MHKQAPRMARDIDVCWRISVTSFNKVSGYWLLVTGNLYPVPNYCLYLIIAL